MSPQKSPTVARLEKQLEASGRARTAFEKRCRELSEACETASCYIDKVGEHMERLQAEQSDLRNLRN